MVLRQEGTTTTTVPQTSACSLFVVVNQLHPGGGKQEKQTLFASTEVPLTQPTIGSCVANFNKQVSSMSLSGMAASNTSNQLCNLPAESTCKGITVTLDNNNMWNEFFRCQTEMILTKQGRRMFPCCRFRISGLEPFQRYTLVMDMQPVDNYRYKWCDRRWETNGKADLHILRSFVHPDSPATGLDWMQNPVSFYKLKLTNNPLDRDGHIIINSMHRYIPRLHIIPGDTAVDVVHLDSPDIITFSFSQTEFFAVTAYQNLSITQLKIDYNPFAKGFRDEASNSRCTKPKSAPSTEKLESEVKSTKEATALNNLKTLFAKINTEKVTTTGDPKSVHCDGPRRVDLESPSSMKRPWPGGLSELIKGAHVKMKKRPPEKNPNGNNEQMVVESLTSKENMDVASMDCISENISISNNTNEEYETLSISKNTDSSTLKNTTKSFSAVSIQCKLNKAFSSTPLNENVDTVLSETAALTEEASQNVVKPLDCGGEVKKKRAEPVPLPLLALFLQQLKSKTRPSRPKAKSEACSLLSQTDSSIHDTSVTENLPSSTASCNPSLITQFSIEPAASSTSQTIASSILTCTVASTEHETVSTPNPTTDTLIGSRASVAPDTQQLSTPKKVSDTTSAFAHNVEPNTDTTPNTTPDTKIVSVILDASSDHVPNGHPAVTFDAPNNELLQSNVSSDKSTPEPGQDFSTVPCPDTVPNSVEWSPSPEVKTPSCAPSSPCISAPSSPDPFPPSMFSDRPIPPRKSLDPFPLCSSLDRPRPLLQAADPVPQKFITRTPPLKVPGPTVVGVTTEVNSPVVSPNPSTPKEFKKIGKTSKGKKYKVKQKKCGKSKMSENTEAIESLIPVPMQPNLEDVEGQLFVSFTSKKALEIHLGDEAKEEVLPKMTEDIKGEVHDEKESIDELEKVLLRDLKNMKYRQVIHPVLQAVGLKLNLLDVTLSIDLQYLGVCLPIPPPVLLAEGSSETCSSQVQFVSRTGKTTDITKIKGWREKFSTSSSVPGATTTSDTGQKNLSAFCSDMLDEYLESEGKLIDERAASFTQAVVTPVAYQLPTKSVSYVRTLDSVLKKQTLPLATTLSKPSATSRQTALTSKNKKVLSKRKRKISSVENTVSSMDKKLSGRSSKKSIKSNTSNSESIVLVAAPGLSQSKKPRKITIKRSNASQNSPKKPLRDSVSGASEGQNASSTSGSNQRSSGLPKTLVKLRDVEDGAVWEGKRRTYITMERADIALSCLVTAEGIMGGSPSTVIKRRAPPCLNDFCRLGCVCVSLVQERRQHHCGKAECMLGCDCLRRRVVLLKNEDTTGSSPISHAEENGTKVKKKNRISYILSGPDAAPEPVLHVKKLWVQQNDSDSEQLYIPDPSMPHPQTVSQDLQKDMENFLHPSPKRKAVRTEGHPDFSSQDSLQEIEEGELRPPTQSGPMKRLEIVSKCKWPSEGSRNVVLRTVCERMAQDRLKQPFWIGKYQIQPTTKTIKETDEGSVITYKVVICQPHLEKSEEKYKEERIKQLEAQLIETIGKSEVKGLPLLSCVTPAGLLKAEKKSSGALGQIMVNGKLYPQAKLELGQMGALHPANRLAAYITGRVCVANKNEPKAAIPASKTSNMACTTSTKPSYPTFTTSTKTAYTFFTTPTSVSSTAVTSTLSSSIALDNSTVLVHYHYRAQLKMSASFSPAISALSPGISESPKIAQKANITSATSGSIDDSIQRVIAIARSGSAATEKTFVLSNTGANVALTGSGIAVMQPLTSTRPAVPSQKMVMLKAGNPAGRVIHLMPLGQFRALNPNIVIRPQTTTLLHVPTSISLNKPRTSTTVNSFTVPSSATINQKKTPLHSSNTDTVMESRSSPTATKPVTLNPGPKTLLICNKQSTVKIVPKLIKDSSTNTLKNLTLSVLEEHKTGEDPRITLTASSAQNSAAGHSANQGLELTSQSFLTLKNQDPKKLDNPVYFSSTPTKESLKENTHRSKMPPESVIFTDHSYTFEMKKTSTQSENPADVSSDSSGSANSSTYHMLLKEVLNVDLVKDAEECGTIGAVQNTESGEESEEGAHLLEVEVNSECTELTEDSDMYSDTDTIPSIDRDDLCVGTHSKKQKNKEKQSVFSQTEKDDELVDIETFEERAEKSPVLFGQTQHDGFLNESSDEENEDLLKVRKRKDEKKRRITLGKCFCNLQQTLNIEDTKVSKIIVLSKALKEIHTLIKQRHCLVNMQDKLRKKRAHYVEMVAQLSGENKASISQRLDEIIAKQKSLEIEDKADDAHLELTKIDLNHSQGNALTKQKEIGTNCKAEHPSTSERKHLKFQDQGAEKVSTNQKITAAKTSQSDKPTNSHPTPQLRKCPSPFPVLCEKTSPNILTHKKLQILPDDQVIPVAKAAPCNEIITISRPLQPIETTSLGERQSTTPGVAAVSISLPPISHSLCVENPLPILQSQVFQLKSSPFNAPVDCIIFPKISSIVSSVQSEKLLTTPPDAAVMQIAESFHFSAGDGQQISSSNEATLVEKEQHLDKQLPEILPKESEHDVKVRIEEDLKEQTTDEENMPKPEQDDEHLMSLLDELVFLNQTSESQGAASSLTEADVLTELLTNKEVDVDRDDERSLSPLFLKLDEDLISSPSSKDEEMDDIPPKVDDLVKVIFGSESPPNSSESEVVAAANDDCTSVSVCHVKHDAPTPPPLLQMKTGGCTTLDSPKEQANMSWRPMPKLAPLGLKTQETGHPKLISSHAPKLDSKLPSLHNTSV
ncbi:MAXprotein-associated protein isoform X2 [Silurus meridionalis]|nr:MAXprotein-associated protein isoform X2 [Silurus meridionalis]